MSDSHLATRPTPDKTSLRRPLALHRNDPVICVRCGRDVPRRARQQKFCSNRCREATKERSRKTGVDAKKVGGRYPTTSAPPNPPKRVNSFNVLRTPKTQSRLSQKLRRQVIETEIFGGREWQPGVSSGGVAYEVSRLRPRALRNGGVS
jgi:hypothetical protein